MAELEPPGLLPRNSMMSISPHVGQPTVPMFDPMDQNAGHSPLPAGRAIRASIRPWRNCRLPAVFRRDDVYWHVPYQHAPVFVRAAVMVKRPPDTETFGPLV